MGCRRLIDQVGTIILVVGAYVALEIATYLLLKELKKSCPWILFSSDEQPKFDLDGLEKFIRHGWDQELGWIRKPNTSHYEVHDDGKRTWYSIDEFGNRRNPGFERSDPIALAYGDSYTFGRLVNDDETWAHFLSQTLGQPVHNRGVGNYGMDQAQIRLEREFEDMPTPVLLIGVVPETIARVHSVWKHLSEYGNHFGFKPRFEIDGDQLVLRPNPVQREGDFREIADLLPDIKARDPFFEWRFIRDIIRLPPLFSLLRSPGRNFLLVAAALWDRLSGGGNLAFSLVMKRNIEFCRHLYEDQSAVELLVKISQRFSNFASSRQSTPVLVIIPQLFDLHLIRQHGHFYQPFVDQVQEAMTTVDVTTKFLESPDFEKYYISDKYGGHLSVEGNQKVAELLFERLKTDPQIAQIIAKDSNRLSSAEIS